MALNWSGAKKQAERMKEELRPYSHQNSQGSNGKTLPTGRADTGVVPGGRTRNMPSKKSDGPKPFKPMPPAMTPAGRTKQAPLLPTAQTALDAMSGGRMLISPQMAAPVLEGARRAQEGPRPLPMPPGRTGGMGTGGFKAEMADRRQSGNYALPGGREDRITELQGKSDTQKAEVDKLKAYLNTLQQSNGGISVFGGGDSGRTAQIQRVQGMAAEAQSKLEALESAVTAEKNALWQEGQDLELLNFEAVRNSSDFNAVAEAGKSADIGLWGRWEPGKRLAASLLDESARGSEADMLDELTGDEKQVMLYYIGKGEFEKAQDYFNALGRDLNARRQAGYSERDAAFAEEHPFQGAAANVMASFASPMAYIGNLLQTGKNAVTGEYEPTDYNSDWFRGAHMVNDTTRGVSEAATRMPLLGDVEIAGKNVGSFVAETGLSMGQFLSKVPLGPAGALTYMGASAGGQTSLDALQRGATPGQALALSTASGIIEAATEKIGLDNLLSIAGSAGKAGVKQALLSVLGQGAIEGTEEAIAEVANNIANLSVMGEKAEFNQYVKSLMTTGLSRSEAEARAFKQFFVVNTAWAAAGGALSGGVLGAGGAVMNQANNSHMLPTGREGRTDGTAGPVLTGPQTQQNTAPQAEAVNNRPGRLQTGAEYDAVRSVGTVPPAGLLEGGRALLTVEQNEQQNTAPQREAAGYRAVIPENVELPTVPIINLSMQDVAALNKGVLPDSGGYLRKTAIERAQNRLGLDQNSAAFIPASNVLRNGEEYILKITKASLQKMFSPSDKGKVPVETIAVMENLERIANNGVYFKSQADRKGRDQVLGVDHLMTTVYIDGTPYVVDMRVRVLQEGKNANKQNVLYYLTPEAITTIKKVDGGTLAAGRPASDGKAPPSSNTTLPPGNSGVKSQFTPASAEVNPSAQETGPGDSDSATGAAGVSSAIDASRTAESPPMDEAYWDSLLTEETTDTTGADRAIDFIDQMINQAETGKFETKQMLTSELSPEKKTAKQKTDAAWGAFKRKFVDAGDAVQKIGKTTGDTALYPYYNAALGAASAGGNMLAEGGAQTNILGQKIGPSLGDLMAPVRAKGADYYNAFQDYLYNRHNIDRMSRDNPAELAAAREALDAFDRNFQKIAAMPEQDLRREATGGPWAAEARERLKLLDNYYKAQSAKNKPIFDYEVGAEASAETAAQYERDYPEFKALAEGIYQYNKNLMQYRVDSGLLTRKLADRIEAIYPHYVPTFRKTEGGVETSELGGVRVSKTVSRATGGNAPLLPLHVAMARQTMKAVREGAKNRFGTRLLGDYMDHQESSSQYIYGAEAYDHGVNEDTFDNLEDNTPQKNNTFMVYRDGQAWEMTVDPSLFEGIQALSPKADTANPMLRVPKAMTDLFKKLTTGYNPLFMARNFARDLQDAGIYSKDFAAWAKNYPQAVAEITSNGPHWQQYKALGGVFSSIFDYNQGYQEKEAAGPVQKVAKRVEALNMGIEQAPRLAEFMGTVKKGDGSLDNLMAAMYNAADVTVNFGRGGTWSKFLNQNFVPFLNPGIQGFDKMVRALTEHSGFKSWAGLAVKASALGIAAGVLNGLLYSDDDEWDVLRQRDKDVNFLFKVGDNLWLKIPKGRTLSLLGMAADRAGRLLRGDETDLGEFISTAASQVAPANPLTNNIFAAWRDADLLNQDSPGRTWFGSDIESRRLQGYAPGQRYDEGTDAISKAIGGALNLSPKKINYLLDQYSGIVGDVALPLLTPRGEQNPVSKAFLLDGVSSNKISGAFYDAADQITYDKNGGDGPMAVVGRYWNVQSGEVGEIYSKIREIETDPDLSDAEKRELVRQEKAALNELQSNALENLEAYEAAAREHYTGADAEQLDEAYLLANRDVFGAEYALKTYDKDVYHKAAGLVNQGISYETFFTVYFDLKDAGGTGKGATDRQRAALLAAEGLSERDKAVLGRTIIGDSRALDYSSESALGISQLSEGTREKAEVAIDAGIDGDVFLAAYEAQTGVEGEKNGAGEMVALSASRNKKAAIDAATPGLSQEDRRVLYELFGVSKSVWYSRSGRLMTGREYDEGRVGMEVKGRGGRLLPRGKDAVK